MKSINFDSGYKTYSINGDENCVIKVQVTDFNLPKRINDAVIEIEALVEKVKSNSSIEEIVVFDGEIRKIINDIFGSDICTAAFGKANVCTIASNGEPIFANFFNAMIPIIKADIDEATKDKAQLSPEAQKYLDDIAEPEQPAE